jgi:hypothetical protein
MHCWASPCPYVNLLSQAAFNGNHRIHLRVLNIRRLGGNSFTDAIEKTLQGFGDRVSL